MQTRSNRSFRLQRLGWFALTLACSAPAMWLAGCSGDDSNTGPIDAGNDTSVPAKDGSSPPVDSGADTSPISTPDASDSGKDAGPATITGMAIVTTSGAPLKASPGDGLSLQVVFTMSDGTTQSLPANTTVSWTAPSTVTAQDPYDAGGGVLPDSGTQPNAFYIANSFRPEHPGVLFVTSAGALDNASDGGVADASVNITVTATLPDASLSAQVAISKAPVGDATRGQNLFQSVLQCAGCHGATGGGSPPSTLADGGLETEPDGAVLYDLQGTKYPYPAPGLNNAPGSGNLATDPNWSAGLLGMAAQADIDNNGVALRAPMPVWFGKMGAGTAPLNAQDFADIYAWLKTQNQ